MFEKVKNILKKVVRLSSNAIEMIIFKIISIFIKIIKNIRIFG